MVLMDEIRYTSIQTKDKYHVSVLHENQPSLEL